MSTEIVVPFGLASDGTIAVTTDANQQVTQHVEALVAIAPGERVMLPNYGAGAANTVFAPDDDVALNLLSIEVKAAMATWEPNVVVNSVHVVPVQNELATGIEIDWTPLTPQSPNARGTQTATILVGGTVVTTS